jgi:hypothetical protein
MTAKELELIRAIQKAHRMSKTPKDQIEKMALVEKMLKERK